MLPVAARVRLKPIALPTPHARILQIRITPAVLVLLYYARVQTRV